MLYKIYKIQVSMQIYNPIPRAVRKHTENILLRGYAESGMLQISIG